MSQPIAGTSYIIQSGDTLSAIAQRTYGDQGMWQEIYAANSQVIGGNPDLIFPGAKLYLPANPQRARIYLNMQSCIVTVASLHGRAKPTAESSIPTSYPQGTVLNFVEVIEGEPVDGNPYWGRSTDQNYFWMGGTSRTQG